VTLERTAAVILASGLSRRFGSNDKLLAPLRGAPVASHVAETVAQMPFHTAIAVVPADNASLADVFEAKGIMPVHNPSAAEGQGASLALGIAQIQRLQVDAALVLLADMPFVTEGHLRALVSSLKTSDAVASMANSIQQPPILFRADTFPALASLGGDKGGKALLRELEDVVDVALPASEAIDIDTPKILSRLQGTSSACCGTRRS